MIMSHCAEWGYLQEPVKRPIWDLEIIETVGKRGGHEGYGEKTWRPIGFYA